MQFYMFYNKNGQVQPTTCHDNTKIGSRHTALLFNLGTRWRLLVRTMPPPFNPQERQVHVAGWASSLWTDMEKSRPHRGSNPEPSSP
jgi:hypothetical protein